MPRSKNTSHREPVVLDGTDAQTLVNEASQPFIGRWNRLVSTTNWEKGRIIAQWREELIAADTPASESSDEAWSRLVGGVTGQHVGRLRRVFQRFSDSYETYEGLYWSHFHAALDWDDAEMWLEGAVQNGWSVSQMRRTRWETLGDDETPQPDERDVVTGELDEDFEPALNNEPLPSSITGVVREVGGASDVVEEDEDVERPAETDTGKKKGSGATIYAADRSEETVSFVRPFEHLGDLPDDLAEAFESFKLAILRHKADDWRQISRDEVLASLDALKELALAPSMEESSF
jgi:hypothetical protein